MTLNETTIWKKNLGISTKNPSKTRLFFLMYIKFTFTFKFHSVPLLNLTVILCRRPSSDTLESINTHRIYCKPDNISASWNQFCWCLVPDLFWLFSPLSQRMFQTPSCFIMKTWIADKVKAVKQNKQLWLSFSNIVMLAWKHLALTMLFFFYFYLKHE